jgi:hypothetical protein
VCEQKGEAGPVEKADAVAVDDDIKSAHFRPAAARRRALVQQQAQGRAYRRLKLLDDLLVLDRDVLLVLISRAIPSKGDANSLYASTATSAPNDNSPLMTK